MENPSNEAILRRLLENIDALGLLQEFSDEAVLRRLRENIDALVLLQESSNEAVFQRLWANIKALVPPQESSDEAVFQRLWANIDALAPPQESSEEAVFQRLQANIDALVPPQELVKPGKYGCCVPQRKYDKGASRDDPHNQNVVFFARQDGTHMSVSAALGEDYTGLVARDIPGLDDAGYTITLRFEWPGYPSYDSQLRTYDWRTPPKRISLAKLAHEVSKAVRQFIQKMEHKPIAPEHQKWRVEPNGFVQLKDLYLASLEQVSAGSYQPRLFWKPEV